FYISRAKCPVLNIHGKEAQVTVAAWVKRKKKNFNQCEAVAGIWNETSRRRQYCLFLNLGIWNSGQQVGGHISGVGGPTTGYKYCMDAAIGQTIVPYGEWQFIALTYDGKQICAYLNGVLDSREKLNPYSYDLGIYDSGENGADFTVGAVDRSGEMGNFFVGRIGGLAIYNRALNVDEIKYLAKNR
ncbi:MAG: LamG domain-containing protein, partial [Bacteroidales bacterium]|nr:LamG domain-containing protein [Bacteroidales bacterium]